MVLKFELEMSIIDRQSSSPNQLSDNFAYSKEAALRQFKEAAARELAMKIMETAKIDTFEGKRYGNTRFQMSVGVYDQNVVFPNLLSLEGLGREADKALGEFYSQFGISKDMLNLRPIEKRHRMSRAPCRVPPVPQIPPTEKMTAAHWDAVKMITDNYEEFFNPGYTLFATVINYDELGRPIDYGNKIRPGSVTIEGREYYFLRWGWTIRVWTQEVDYHKYLQDHKDFIAECDLTPDSISNKE